ISAFRRAWERSANTRDNAPNWSSPAGPGPDTLPGVRTHRRRPCYPALIGSPGTGGAGGLLYSTAGIYRCARPRGGAGRLRTSTVAALAGTLKPCPGPGFMVAFRKTANMSGPCHGRGSLSSKAWDLWAGSMAAIAEVCHEEHPGSDRWWGSRRSYFRNRP